MVVLNIFCAVSSGATIRELTYHLNISRRTAFRLLEALEGLGFPLIGAKPKTRNEKVYRLIESYVLKLPNISIPNPGFTRQELEFLIAAMDAAKQPDKMPIANSIRSKIIAFSLNSNKA